MNKGSLPRLIAHTLLAGQISPNHAPDGLDQQDINQLVWDACADSISSPRATSALLDGTALERRERREARRAMNAVVRDLPSRVVDPKDDGTDQRAA